MGVKDGMFNDLVSLPFSHNFTLYFVIYFIVVYSFIILKMGDCSSASSWAIIFPVIVLSFQFIELFHFSRGQGIHLYFSIVGVINGCAHV